VAEEKIDRCGGLPLKGYGVGVGVGKECGCGDDQQKVAIHTDLDA
jgi:hypothetical protein